MSSHTQFKPLIQTLLKQPAKKHTSSVHVFIVGALAFSVVGCSSTQEFKPTASVIVGAQTSL